MVREVRQIVVVEEGGVVHLPSDKFSVGERVELIARAAREPADSSSRADVTGEPKKSWRDFFGAVSSGDPNSADNDRIDSDLAREAMGFHSDDTPHVP